MPEPTTDFFNINPTVAKEETLVDKFARERLEWSEKLGDMSLQMKSVLKVSELMTEVYTERQRCVEYHHYLISILIKVNKEYRRQFSERHDFWSYKSNIRYPNETSKNNKIQVELADILEKREMIDNHAKFILETKNTIDNIVYAIPKRIDIEKIARGSL
jgi:hypothetical protein